MDDILFAFTGVILQVLGLIAAFSNVALGLAQLLAQLMSKDSPRFSDESENRGNKNSPNRRSASRPVRSSPLLAGRLLL